ncbi:hypothetical protein HJC23_008068 [Cyclotella cryptica]|uniref:DDE Tnp4 domain-containing protein n=1 Tax=Cyclotella cryptica TaxID=29204 RepID=A0ABD3P045_9STRA
MKGKRAGGNYKEPPVSNGSVQLACAIVSLLAVPHIVCIYGVSYQSVLESVWIIVEAISMTPEFYIFYRESLEAQRKIAARFEKSSTPKINNCAGAIDGILTWTTKPSLADAKSSVSDYWGRFVDVSIIYGGSTADWLTFKGSDLYKQLNKGLMKQDLGKQPFLLFGDNAYLNSSSMTTPYPNVSNDLGKKAKDDYNFYHSQLSIQVECAFGYCKGHCPHKTPQFKEILPSLEADDNVLITKDDDYVKMVRVNEAETALLTDLMNGGHHYDDVPSGILLAHYNSINQASLPRTAIHNFIAEGQWERPQLGKKTNRHA